METANMTTIEDLWKGLDKANPLGTNYYYQGAYRKVIGYRLSQGIADTNNVYLIYVVSTKSGLRDVIVNTFSPVDGLSYNLSPFITSYSDLLKKIKYYCDLSGYYKTPEDLWRDILKWRKVLGYEED